jgi:sec-independent protein translocase protein TatA
VARLEATAGSAVAHLEATAGSRLPKDTTMLTDILQPTHLIILLIVALIVLGPKRLPDAGRALGQGLKEFKSSISVGHDDNRNPRAASHPQDPPRVDTPH